MANMVTLNMMQKLTANMTVKAVNTTKGFPIYICLFVLVWFVLVWLFGFTSFTFAEKPPENILKNGDFDLNLEG